MANRNQLDALFASGQAAILLRLENARNRHGRYVQMLRGGGMPSDEVEDVAQVENLPPWVRTDTEIHVYTGPLGVGMDWVLHAEEAGVEYRRVVSFGPEAAWRQQPWEEVVNGPA